MKTFILVIGIILLAACVISFIAAALQWFMYRNLLDGSSEQYKRLHDHAITFLVIGIVLALIGGGCIVIRCVCF